MAALVVVDSGIVLATVLAEEVSEKAKALIASWTSHHMQLGAVWSKKLIGKGMALSYAVAAVNEFTVPLATANNAGSCETRRCDERLGHRYPLE